MAGPTPVVSASGANYGAMSPEGKAGSKRSMLLIIGGIVGAALIGVAIFAVIHFMGGVKLEAYSDENFTLQVPAGYEQEKEDNGISFKEKDGDKTRSEVGVFYEAFPEELSDDQLAEARSVLKDQLGDFTDELVQDSDYGVENVKTAETTFKGAQGYRITGDLVEDGKNVGKFTMVMVMTNKEVYLVGVAANDSDPGVGKKAETIINSFEVK
jgi:hypothetical protein